MITKAEGKNLIQSCLNSPDVNPTTTPVNTPQVQQHHHPRVYDPPMYSGDGMNYDDDEKKTSLMRMKEPTMPSNLNYPNVGGLHRQMQSNGIAVPHYMYQPPHHYSPNPTQQFPQYAQIKNQPYPPMHGQHSHSDDHTHHGSHQDQ